MAVDLAGDLAVKADNYPSIFRAIIMRNAQKNLREVRAVDGILPEEEREQALHTLSFTIKMLDAWETTYALLSEMSPKMIQAGLCDEWVPYLQRGIEQSQVEKDLHGQGELQLQLGSLYQLQGKFEFAYDSLTSSAKVFQDLNESANHAIVLNRLAAVTRRQSQHEQAQSLVDNALSLLSRDDPEIANSYVVLGELAFDERNWEEAEDYFTQALTIWEREGDQRKMAVGLRNVGVAYAAQGKYEKAVIYYKNAILSLQREHDHLNCAITQMNLGTVYLTSNNELEKAVDLYHNAEIVFRRFNDDLHLTMVYNNLGMTYRKLKSWSKAEKACTLSIILWGKLGNLRQELNSVDELGLVLLEKGDFSQAIKLFEEALERLESIRDVPGYDRLLELLTDHLNDACVTKKRHAS